MKKEAEFRTSTLAEREEFYEKEFSLEKAKKWFRKNKMPFPQLCAIDAGSDTKIILDKKNKDKMLYFKFKDLKKYIKKYIPEDIYYDRNHYKNPDKILNTLNFKNNIFQELAFDVDVDNIGKKVNKTNLKKTYNWALKIKKILKSEFNFKKIQIVYSGRGFHVHVFDKKAYFLTIQERSNI